MYRISFLGWSWKRVCTTICRSFWFWKNKVLGFTSSSCRAGYFQEVAVRFTPTPHPWMLQFRHRTPVFFKNNATGYVNQAVEGWVVQFPTLPASRLTSLSSAAVELHSQARRILPRGRKEPDELGGERGTDRGVHQRIARRTRGGKLLDPTEME